jgi:maleylacetate reductase
VTAVTTVTTVTTTPLEFTRTALPGDIVFGNGALGTLGAELDARRLTRVMVIAAASATAFMETVESSLGDRVVLVWTELAQHVPEGLAARATASALGTGADVLVTIGGGSATGLGKAIAVRTKLPLVAIPTTYSGSEMTPIYGLTSDGQKRTARDKHAVPQLVIYDPHLLAGLPSGVVGSSALNALAHCAEALWAAKRDPVTDVIALDGAGRIHDHLPAACADGDLDARAQLLLGASMAGTALASAGTSLHHSLCHLLGGMFDSPHAQTHAILLPYVIAFLRPVIAGPVRDLASRFGTSAGELEYEIWRLGRSVGIPHGLRDIGLTQAQVDQAAQAALANQLPSPRRYDAGDLGALLSAAWAGEPLSATATEP